MRNTDDLVRAVASLQQQLKRVEADMNRIYTHGARHGGDGGDRIPTVAVDDGDATIPGISFQAAPAATGWFRSGNDIHEYVNGVHVRTINADGEAWNETNSETPQVVSNGFTAWQPTGTGAWETAGTLTVWQHTGNNRNISVEAWGQGSCEWDAGFRRVVMRLEISHDGGSTWTTGSEQNSSLSTDNPWTCFAPVQYKRALATGNVQVRLQGWRNGTITNFQDLYLFARAEQYF